MYRPIVKPPESEPAPQNYGVVPSADGKSCEIVPVEPPTYPPVDAFDIDKLNALGISPSVTPPVLTDSIESFEKSINEIEDNTTIL